MIIKICENCHTELEDDGSCLCDPDEWDRDVMLAAKDDDV